MHWLDSTSNSSQECTQPLLVNELLSSDNSAAARLPRKTPHDFMIIIVVQEAEYVFLQSNDLQEPDPCGYPCMPNPKCFQGGLDMQIRSSDETDTTMQE